MRTMPIAGEIIITCSKHVCFINLALYWRELQTNKKKITS